MELQIKQETMNKIMHWINKSDDEVSGFGKVTYHPTNGVFEVDDAYLLKQTNGAAHTDIDAQSLGRLMYTTKDDPGELRWWWHSHVNMNVFWSGTDTATIKELGSQGWIVATVFNKREEHRTALGYMAKVTSDFSDVTEYVLKDELPTYVMSEVDEEVTKAWDLEYDNNVQPKQVSWMDGSYIYDPKIGVGMRGTQIGVGMRGTQIGVGMRGTQTAADIPNGIPTEGDLMDLYDKGDYEYYREHGYYGLGAMAEARCLGMAMPAYVGMLCTSTAKQLQWLEHELQTAIDNGELK